MVTTSDHDLAAENTVAGFSGAIVGSIFFWGWGGWGWEWSGD